MKKEIKINKKSGFTLIEAMTVLFILGLLSATAALGYGQINRDKALDQASQRVGQKIAQSRDYGIFGKEVDGKFPCGYGVRFKKSAEGDTGTDLLLFYISNKDRVTAMDADKTCDEEILGGGISLARNTTDEAEYVSLPTDKLIHLKNVLISKILDSSGTETDALTTLFSSPRGVSYYYLKGGSASCDDDGNPSGCVFKVFSEISGSNSTFFKIILSIKDGNTTSTKVVRVLPSGNIEVSDN